LQLPLYRHLAKTLGIQGPVDLGYILLPKNTADTGHKRAEWSDVELLAADQKAFEVIRAIRAEKFWPPASEPAAFTADLAAICQDDVFAAASLAADEAEDDET
jgi:ATP-dependent helicase/nuclease subunit B